MPILESVQNGQIAPPSPEFKPRPEVMDAFKEQLRQQGEDLQKRLGLISDPEIAALMSRVTSPMLESAEPVYLFCFFPAVRESTHTGVLVPTVDGRGTRESIRYYTMPASPDRDTVAFCRFSLEAHAHRQPGDNDDDPREIAKFNGPRRIDTIPAEQVASGFVDEHYALAVNSEQSGGIGYVIVRGNDLPAEFGRLTNGIIPLEALEREPTLSRDVFAQIMAARASQLTYVQWVTAHCNSLHSSQRGQEITNHHRRMVHWGLGEVEASRFPWFGISTISALKNCFLCQGPLPRKALFCPNCNNDLIAKGLEHMGYGLEINDTDVLAKVLEIEEKRRAKNSLPQTEAAAMQAAAERAAQAARDALTARITEVDAKQAEVPQPAQTVPANRPQDLARAAMGKR